MDIYNLSLFFERRSLSELSIGSSFKQVEAEQKRSRVPIPADPKIIGTLQGQRKAEFRN